MTEVEALAPMASRKTYPSVSDYVLLDGNAIGVSLMYGTCSYRAIGARRYAACLLARHDMFPTQSRGRQIIWTVTTLSSRRARW